MTIRKSLTAILAAGMLLSQSVRAAAAAPIQQAPIQSNFQSQQVLQYNQYNAAVPANPRAAAMAYGHFYESTSSARIGAGGLYLTTRTGTFNIMRKIGLKSVTMEYSSNGVSGWRTVANYGEIVTYNSNSQRITNRFFSSTNGAGYYRFKVIHIAYNSPFDYQESDPQYTAAFWLYY
ncbi:MAG: hypothetical protein IKH27_05045 [Oscillospiraceae bacterium]|nr:hypothetical protein [Oscillospiraceae bacterium]